jgi:hypothetical protein
MKPFTVKFIYNVEGGHTRVLIRAGKKGGTLGLCGEIKMTNEEFEAFKNAKAEIVFAEAEEI